MPMALIAGTPDSEELFANGANFEADEVLGLGGDDTIHGGVHPQDTVETLNGGAGDDSIIGFTGSFLLIGGAGDDTLIGQGSEDAFRGGSGRDYIREFGSDAFGDGFRTDTFDGGGGNDTLHFGS